MFGPMCFDSFEYRLLLISRFSIITSTTQSKSLSCSKSSSIFPGFILLAFRLCISISGFDLCIIWMAFRASALLSCSSLDTISRRRTSQPAFAQWAAIPAPITPLPMTATFSIVLDILSPRFFLERWQFLGLRLRTL